MFLFYSFKDLQSNVQLGRIDSAELSNGDKFVLFKRDDMLSFFNMIKVHFPRLKETDQIDESEEEMPISAPTTTPSKKLKLSVSFQMLFLTNQLSYSLILW